MDGVAFTESGLILLSWFCFDVTWMALRLAGGASYHDLLSQCYCTDANTIVIIYT